MRVVREPLQLELEGACRSDPRLIEKVLQRAARGSPNEDWETPDWLLAHQTDAARRIAGSLDVFGGALLADAVGLGKTYVSLAVSTLYRKSAALVPASLVSQWANVARRLGTPITLLSHESVSRGRRVPEADLVIVDEAHRFRNPESRRYDRLARDLRSHLLLVTATPVVNRPQDLVSLLRLFLPDNGLAVLGLSSFEQAVAHRDYTTIAHASAPLIVARSLRVLAGRLQMPHPTDSRVHRLPSLDSCRLEGLIEDITALTFPGTADGRAIELLRGHLLHRLGSSTAACRETLRRHLAYLDRALTAFSQGQNLSRCVARHLFGPGDDLQLELGALMQSTSPLMPTRGEFEKERGRVIQLLEQLPVAEHPNPKASCLQQILDLRKKRRTIVFVSAVSTALDLARRLRWQWIAVVGGGRAWIASGRVPVDAALGLFAPRARRAAEPSPTTRVTTLIATDLVSEGLDLQDADGIVHYDLPWTPLRLAQRLGRVARLGSEHRSAYVYWFEPPSLLEQKLQTARRIKQKMGQQLQLGVAVTSTIGRAQVMNTMFEFRERLAYPAVGTTKPTDRIPTAVVQGPVGLLLAVAWRLPGGTCRELIALTGDPPRPVRDYRVTHALKHALCRAPSCTGDDPHSQIQAGLSMLRSRLRTGCSAPTDGDTIRLRRAIMTQARTAGQRRDINLIELLDALLDHLASGLCAGPIRELTELLDVNPSKVALRTWLNHHSRRSMAAPACRIEAVLCGDGTGS